VPERLAMTISDTGWRDYNIWEHSHTVRDLYARRCRLEAEEMTCAAQAAELLRPHVQPGDVLLDVGCGSGYFFHSLKSRDIGVDYYGIDASPSLIAIGRQCMPQHGLSPDRLIVMRIEDLTGAVDHTVCMNVLSNIDNYQRPLERLLKITRKTLVLRESLKKGASYRYVKDEFLDPGCDLKVHVNAYDLEETCEFIRSYGFEAQVVKDRRSGGSPETVIGHLHYWTFVMAMRSRPAQP
jgi:ubiquinone/menaquinone biosynthesis C-methylase UbiE